MLNQDWVCSLRYVYQEGDQAADFLAKLGASTNDDNHIWDKPPVGLGLTLLADASAMQFLR